MSLQSLTSFGQPRNINAPGIHPISDGFGIFYKGTAMVGDRFKKALSWLNYIPLVGGALEDLSEGALSTVKLGFDITKPVFGVAANIFSRIENTSTAQALYKQFYSSYGIDPTHHALLNPEGLGHGPSSLTLASAASHAGSLSITPPTTTVPNETAFSGTVNMGISPGIHGAPTQIG